MAEYIHSNGKWGISMHWVTVLSMLYLAIPCMLFLSSWFVPVVAWPVNLAIIVNLFFFAKHAPSKECWHAGGLECGGIILSAIVCFIAFILAGIAGYFTPAPDVLIFREALYNNLIREAWPLVLPGGKEMSYYLAGMLPPALLARITEDYTAQRLIAAAWYAAGLWLTLMLFFCRERRFSLLFLLFFFLFKDPAYLLINSIAGTGEIWNFAARFIPLPNNDYTGTPHPVQMMLLNAQGCNFHPYTLLCAALILNVKHKLAHVAPLIITLLLPSSPMGALGCLPLAVPAWIQGVRNSRGSCMRALVLPICLALLSALYYMRAESATCAGVFPVLLQSWTDFFLHFYLGIVLSTLLFCIILGRKRIAESRSLQISIACCLIMPWFYLGSSRESGLFGLNELWLKSSLIYHMHLIAVLCFSWKQIKWNKYVYIISFLLLLIRDERICSIRFTGSPVVQDVWQGHLNHQHPSIYQKVPTCRPCCIPGLMLSGAEAEEVFPGYILPKAPGCDYAKPMQPDGKFITH